MLESVSTDSRHYPQERGAVDASRECPHDVAPSLSHLEASRAVLGLALARRQETGKLRHIQEIAMAD
jgi:hypothetical protein